MNLLRNRKFVVFVAKFIATFFLCYLTTLAIIGLAAPEGRYSPFVHNYLDYVRWLRSTLLWGTKILLKWIGVETYLASPYNIRQVNGRGIVIVYECVGYGIMSFWTAFIVALEGSSVKKILWWIAGILVFWLLNVARLSILLVATNRNWQLPFGWDHHTWFSIVGYGVMLLMIYLFDKKSGNESANKDAARTTNQTQLSK